MVVKSGFLWFGCISGVVGVGDTSIRGRLVRDCVLMRVMFLNIKEVVEKLILKFFCEIIITFE